MAVTATDVKDILDTDLIDADVDTYISQAGSIVTNDTVQTWLTAHLIRISRDREVGSENVGDHRVDFSGDTGLGLDSTRYGQMAQYFDTANELPSARKNSDVHITSW